MSTIRARLSFFRDGPVVQGESFRDADRKLLDQIFECRMGGVTAMLEKATAGKKISRLMISESSNNGVLEFDAAGRPEEEQPNLLVESRALDESKRAQSFYQRNIYTYSAGLMYFTYQNEHDKTINLDIGGASGMPSVLASIYDFAKINAGAARE